MPIPEIQSQIDILMDEVNDLMELQIVEEYMLDPEKRHRLEPFALSILQSWGEMKLQGSAG